MSTWSVGFRERNVVETVPLARLTTFRIGGPAEVVTLRTPTDLSEALARPHRLLGRGANLLVDDAGVPEAVLRLGEPFAVCTVVQERADEVVLEVGGGMDLAKLVNLAAARGWQGFETLAGVPATVGGALHMNAGTRHGWISDTLEAVQIARPDGALEWIGKEVLRPTYRHGGLPPGAFAVAGRFRLAKGDPAAIKARGTALKQAKAASQPLALASAGCVFTNPSPEVPAGRLVDELGLKGLRAGGAVISPVHANFIVNEGGATATEVWTLVRTIRARAKAERGVDLTMEIQWWGGPAEEAEGGI